MAQTITKKDIKKWMAAVCVIATLVFIAGGGLAYWGYSFASGTVHSQLAQEKITFPDAGSSQLDPKEFPTLQQYGGQAVDNGAKAKAYANDFIWVHMMKASGGKTYAQISAQAQANPSDAKLASLKTTLFQGDMLRSSLLTAYAFSVFGDVAWWSAIALWTFAAISLLAAIGFIARARA